MVLFSTLAFALWGALAGLDLRCTRYREHSLARFTLVGALVGGLIGLALGLFLQAILWEV